MCSPLTGGGVSFNVLNIRCEYGWGSTVPYFEKLVRSHVVVPLDPFLETFCVNLGLRDTASVGGNMLPIFVYIWHRVFRAQGGVSAGQASDRELKGPTVCILLVMRQPRVKLNKVAGPEGG